VGGGCFQVAETKGSESTGGAAHVTIMEGTEMKEALK